LGSFSMTTYIGHHIGQTLLQDESNLYHTMSDREPLDVKVDMEHHHHNDHHNDHHNHHNDDNDDDIRGTLKCDGDGPSAQIAQEMIYWRDYPQDTLQQSPYQSLPNHPPPHQTKKKYMTVELDAGGFNNVRMTIEIAMAWAKATGRILVIPPRQGIYLMKGTYTLHDFYNLEGLDVMDMQDFLEMEVMTGEFGSLFPPDNRTDWSEQTPRHGIFENEDADSRILNQYLRTIGWNTRWLAGQTLLYIAEDPECKEIPTSRDRHIFREEGHPTPFNATWQDRLAEVNVDDRDILLYDHTPDLIHIMADDEAWIRLMHHFYYTIFFQSWSMDLWIKRYIRDKLRYKDELFCRAGQIVEALRQASVKEGNHGEFYTFHIRRGDFAHIGLVDDSQEIIDITLGIVPRDAIVYIATDQKDKTWFSAFQNHFRGVYFLEDFPSQTEGMEDTSFFGFLDQIVASRGKAFFGAFQSTFTAHIITMMGYYSQIHKSPGYENGVIPAYFYAPTEVTNTYQDGYRPFRVNEDLIEMAYPLGWTGIDNGIDDFF